MLRHKTKYTNSNKYIRTLWFYIPRSIFYLRARVCKEAKCCTCAVAAITDRSTGREAGSVLVIAQCTVTSLIVCKSYHSLILLVFDSVSLFKKLFADYSFVTGKKLKS